MIRHLHQDYNTSFCGRDAAHILMTHHEGEADCPACHQALGQRLADEARAKADERTRLDQHTAAAAERRAEARAAKPADV